MGYRWRGFRKVRKQVRKRLRRRLESLGVADLDGYRGFLQEHRDEWDVLDSFCRITISHFYRNRRFFDHLSEWVAQLAAERPGRTLRLWSAGCASGEEPYTLSLIWAFRVAPRAPDRAVSVLATDLEPVVLDRARRAVYPPGSLRELPPSWRETAFETVESGYRLRGEYRRCVVFRCEDIRDSWPNGPFDVVLCRNLVLTYFDEPEQRRVMEQVRDRLRIGGLLGVGSHESLPTGLGGFEPVPEERGLYRRASPSPGIETG